MQTVHVDPSVSVPVDVPEIISSKIESNSSSLKSIGFYRRELMPLLGPEVFLTNPKRLFWFASTSIVSLAAFCAIVFLDLPWFAKLPLGILIGLANGVLGFATHELLHGSIVKNERVQNVLGFFWSAPISDFSNLLALRS